MRYSYTGSSLGAELTEEEYAWLKTEQPRMFYLHPERKVYGYFAISSQFENLQRITTQYEIAIDFARCIKTFVPSRTCVILPAVEFTSSITIV